MSWELESLSRDKLWAVAALQESHYGRKDDTANEAFLDYEYYQNPLGASIGEIAWDKNSQQAVGGYCLTPIRLKIGNEIKLAYHSANSLTRKEYRGQGIYSAMVECAMARAKNAGGVIAYGMPNPNSHPILTKKFEMKDIGAVPLYLYPLRPSGVIRSFIGSHMLSMMVRPFDPLFDRKPNIDIEIVRLTLDNLDLVDCFWKKISEKYLVMFLRDRQWIAYRFLRIPRRNYFCYFAMQNNEPVAYVCGRVMQVSGIQCGMIADFLYLSGFEKEAQVLVRALLQKLKAKDAALAGCLMLPHTGEAGVLNRCGFFRCPKIMEPQPFRFCVRTFSTDSTELLHNRGNWFFTMGDYDVV